MQAEGLTSYFPMERLAVMGLVKCSGGCASCSSAART
jgi:lipid A disaccharide synthetase